MRVFIVGTGRCGSVTFTKACEYVANYTVGHESVFTQTDPLKYPDWHIEVSPPLYIAIPLLRELYPDCKVIHLRREPDPCIDSLARLLTPDGTHWIDTWAWCYCGWQNGPGRRNVAAYFYHSVTTIIEALQPDLTISLETVRDQWAPFWALIGAAGDFEASRNVWLTRHNTGQQRGEK